MKEPYFLIPKPAYLALTFVASMANGQTYTPQDERAWESWQLFLAECREIITDNDAYIAGASGLAGELSVERSPDGNVTAHSKTLVSIYVDGIVTRFPDRVSTQCSFVYEYDNVTDERALTSAFTDRILSETNFQIVGGYAPLYTEESFLAVLGAWPEFDQISHVRFSEYEAQFYITHTQILDVN